MKFGKLFEVVKGFLSVYYKQSLIGLAAAAVTATAVTGTVIAVNSNSSKVVAEETSEATIETEEITENEETTEETLEETTEVAADTQLRQNMQLL